MKRDEKREVQGPLDTQNFDDFSGKLCEMQGNGAGGVGEQFVIATERHKAVLGALNGVQGHLEMVSMGESG